MHDLRIPLTTIEASNGIVLANEPPGTPELLHRLLVNIDLAGTHGDEPAGPRALLRLFAASHVTSFTLP